MPLLKPEEYLAVTGIKLMPRDKDICVFLQRWRYANIDQLVAKFDASYSVMYRRLGKLSQAGLIKQEQVLTKDLGVYRCLPKGRALAGTGLPPVEHISLHLYRHTVAVVDVALAIEKEDARILSETELRSDKGMNTFSAKRGKKDHCPDIIAYMPDGSTVAIEAELTGKNKERIQEILLWYFQHSEYQQVRYYVPNEAMAQRILNYGGNKSYIKIYMLDTMQPRIISQGELKL